MTESRSFGAALRALYEGHITFDRFVSETKNRWKKLAIYLRERWKQPIWHGLEDVIQELLTGAWRSIKKFDPKRGTSLERYVIFNSVDKAKKACHKARGAKLSGSADRNQSNLETPFVMYDEETERFVSDLLFEDANQHQHVERIEAIERAKKHCETMKEKLVFDSLSETQKLNIDVTSTIIVSADLLYGDYRTRLACRFSNEEHALRLVTKVITDVAHRMNQGAES